MSPLRRGDPFSGDHGRARELAALRLDEPLDPRDEAWLDAHLSACDDCRSVADAYDEQRGLLRALRDVAPVPPRDLWARTAAAIESDDRRGPRRAGRPWRIALLPLAPAVAVIVVAVLVGAPLLTGIGLVPLGPAASGSPGATPIQLTAGAVQILTRSEDGTLELGTGHINEVCPIGAESCSSTTATDNTQLSKLGDLGSFDAVISPDQDRIVLMQRGTGAGGVYVVPVRETVTPSPSTPATPAPATPSATPGGSASATPEPSASSSPELTPEPTAPPASASPSGTPDVGPSASASNEPSATPVEPSGSPVATPEVSPPAPTPTVTVTPAADGTLEIARDVIVVGTISGYSADGLAFAFTARPADGSAGPDVYFWHLGDSSARRVTHDSMSLFSGWIGERMLVSRVVDGQPTTVLLDPETATESAVGARTMWRPVVAPDRATAVWWDGTLVPSGDGFTWSPADGTLVLGAWPRGGRGQELSVGRVRDWQARWDESGTTLGLWIANEEPGAPGQLSLYRIDPRTGEADLANPLLRNEPAFEGFSLRQGRLVWTAPRNAGGTGEDTTVQILAWSGDTWGRLQLSTQEGVTVIR